jgi:predicted DNA-binding protein YlxM (UPF0122 family)
MSEADSSEYPVKDISEQVRIREDRLYDRLDDTVSFFSTLQEAITLLGGMQDPSRSKLFEKIDRISREDARKWKRSACYQALKGIGKHHPPMEKKT